MTQSSAEIIQDQFRCMIARSSVILSKKIRGEIELDDGASEAIKNKGASLLLVGVKKISGDFIANQPVKVINPEGEEIAKGICSMSSDAIKIGINSISTPTGRG